jgi:hypothetical protein
MVSVFVIRTFIKHFLPNPLEGIRGFDTKRVIENNGGVMLAFAFLMYLKKPIQSKVDNLYKFF